MKNFLTTSILLASSLFYAVQANENHSKATLIHDYDTFNNGIRVGVFVELEKGWHAYWQNPGDVGAAPDLQITSSSPIEQSDLAYPIPNRISSGLYDSFGYKNETVFYKTLESKSSLTEPVDLHIQFDWLVCKDICVPNSKSFSLRLPVKESARKKTVLDSFSYPKYREPLHAKLSFESTQTLLTVSSENLDISNADFFPTTMMQEIFSRPTSKKAKAHEVTYHYPATKSKNDTISGVLKINSKEAYWIGVDSPVASNSTQETSSKYPIWYVLLLAFLGGLLLNLMPCVLPVVSLKLLSVLKSGGVHSKKIIKSNLLYSLGICSSILAFSLIFLAIRNAGSALGWGFQLQSPGFVVCLIILSFAIGLNLIGFFEIRSIPLPWLGKSLASSSGTSDFLAGLFITVLATPCTAPFMAVAIGYALTQPPLTLISTFLSLGIGLSFPYLLLAGFPKLARFFPKPGNWMITLKEVLSFPMFLTAAWLIWVLTQLTQATSAFYILTALTLIVFFFWSQKKLLATDSFNRRIFLGIVLLAIIAVSFQSLQTSSDGKIAWEPFKKSQLNEFAASSTPVFINFTADWCLTCKTNEQITFTNDKVIQAIEKSKVRMIKGDWTLQNPEITSILKEYDRAGVPFYLLFKPGLTTPVVLPTLLTPSVFINAINDKGDQP